MFVAHVAKGYDLSPWICRVRVEELTAIAAKPDDADP
jgi:hypothetical protein